MPKTKKNKELKPKKTSKSSNKPRKKKTLLPPVDSSLLPIKEIPPAKEPEPVTPELELPPEPKRNWFDRFADWLAGK